MIGKNRPGFLYKIFIHNPCDINPRLMFILGAKTLYYHNTSNHKMQPIT